MNVPLIFGALVVLTGALVVLRFFWPRLAPRTRTLILVCACMFPALRIASTLSAWYMTSIRMNALLYWCGIAGLEFLLILFTRLRPRWLTTIIAVILILPVLSASILLPLGELFDPPPVTATALGDRLVTWRMPWGTANSPRGGTDLTLYYQPPRVPFLHRQILSDRFFGGQCNAAEAYAELLPDRKTVLAMCPGLPDLPPKSAHHDIDGEN